MLLAGRNLKNIFKDLSHVTCVCHALSRVCEMVRENYPEVDALVEIFCRIFKVPRRRMLLESRSGLTVATFPVRTRWGTWMKFCMYLNTFMDDIVDLLILYRDEDISHVDRLVAGLTHS